MGVGPFLEPYHDREWGVPVHDDRRHFEFLVLEAAQAGLSWLTILKRRDGYRRAFLDFEPAAVAELGPADVERLLDDAAIIRNRRKIESTISNARAFLEVRKEFGNVRPLHLGVRPRDAAREPLGPDSPIPAETALSKEVGGDLRRRGFGFLGPVTCYAYLQATGLVMDHVTTCFRWEELPGRSTGRISQPARNGP